MRQRGGIVLVLLLGLLLGSCTARKFLSSEECYLNGYTIHLKTDLSGEKKGLLNEELALVLELKPTAKMITGSRPGAWFFHTCKNDSTGLKKWMFQHWGKKPAYLSQVPLKQYEDYLNRVMEIEGFYHAHVSSEIIRKKNSAEIQFQIESNDPVRINSVQADFRSTRLMALTDPILEHTTLEEGRILHLSDLEQERIRIADQLHDSGYFYFSSEYLIFEVDTTRALGKANVFIGLKENTPEDAVLKYNTGTIKIYPDFHLTDSTGYVEEDAEMLEGIEIISKRNSLKNKVLRKYIHYHVNDVLCHENHQHSLSDIGNLGLYKFINAIPEQNIADTSVNISIFLTPEVKHSLKAEFSIISKSNNFTGPGISISHINKNAFRGGEKFNNSLNFAYETQLGGKRSGLNAYEIGITSHLDLPGHRLPFLNLENVRLKKPYSAIYGSYNFQKRVNQFALNSINASFYYDWKWKEALTHRLGLMKLTYLKITDVSADFQQVIQNNPILAASFRDNLLPEMDYELTYKPEKRGKIPHYFYMHANIAGNVSNGILNLMDDGTPVNNLFGVPISQFARIFTEGRKFIYHKKSAVAIRGIAGVGWAYGNSTALPYQKQFFSGGSNSIRAFPSRLLGPGSVQPGNAGNTSRFLDQTGDMRLELNAEYRMKLNSITEFATFADAGNIWLLREDALRPGGKFEWNQFYKQIAIGTGMGIRFDFDFFLIRFDLAFPLRVPYHDPGNRWVVQDINPLKSQWRKDNLILNIGIGHPF